MSSQRIVLSLSRLALLAIFLMIATSVEQPVAALNMRPSTTINRAAYQAGLCASVTEIPTTQCDALVALYNSTNGANWTNHTGWNVTNTPCSWYGITCTTGHVTRVELSNNQVTGSLPSQLGNLPQLQFLIFQANQLTGAIPPELGNLTNLISLGLSENQLSGSIPPQLGSLTNLWWLTLNTNQLTGSIPSQLGNMTNLRDLRLENNQLTGTIPSQLANLTNLQELVLSNNQLSGSIPAQLGNLSNLLYIQLAANQLTGSIPPELENLPNLLLLSLSANQLSGSIPLELGNLTSLQNLSLANNGLAGTIPSQLGSLANLQMLALFGNQLRGSIPPELGNLANLQTLTLYSNQLSGSIPPELGDLTSLQWMSLSDNQFSGSIPPELGNLANLQSLDLYTNGLSGSIPPELGSLASLSALHLNDNQLNDSIPSQLGNLTSLQFLYLDSNHLTGSIPSELGSLTNLRTLSLSNNQLNGSIPSELGDLSNLTELFLANNQLSGDIPPQLANLTLNPVATDLGYNKLTATDSQLLNVLESTDADWDETQTVPAKNLFPTDMTATTVALAWTPILYTADGGYYVVSYATAAGGPYTEAGQTTDKTEAAFTVSGLTTDTPYYFVVQSYTPAHGDQQNELLSDYSEEIQAMPATPTLDTPILLQPADNSTTTDSHPAFTWNGVSQADHYEFQIGLALPLISEPIISAVPAFTPANNLFAHTYYWRVRAVDALGGTSLWSDPWTVTIESPLTDRALRDRYTTNTPTLTWGEISWADRYEVQVATDNSFDANSLVYANDQILSNTLYVTTDPLPNGTYYWHVRALEADGTPGDWSATDTFAVDVP